MKTFYTDGTAPGSLGGDLTIRMKMLIGATTINYCYLHRRHQTVHVVASVTVVTEQQLVVVLTRPAEGAGLALDALPGVLLDTDQHVVRELEAGGVTWQ